MGSLIGQPIKDILLEHDIHDYSKLHIVGIVTYDPETNEKCTFVISDESDFEKTCIKLIRQQQ
jgi:hypothetical protein